MQTVLLDNFHRLHLLQYGAAFYWDAETWLDIQVDLSREIITIQAHQPRCRICGCITLEKLVPVPRRRIAICEDCVGSAVRSLKKRYGIDSQEELVRIVTGRRRK